MVNEKFGKKFNMGVLGNNCFMDYTLVQINCQMPLSILKEYPLRTYSLLYGNYNCSHQLIVSKIN